MAHFSGLITSLRAGPEAWPAGFVIGPSGPSAVLDGPTYVVDPTLCSNDPDHSSRRFNRGAPDYTLTCGQWLGSEAASKKQSCTDACIDEHVGQRGAGTDKGPNW